MTDQKLGRTLLLLAGMGALGCGNSDLNQSSELGRLRILGIQADRPEVNPEIDGGFNIVPIVSDLDGAGRTLSYQLEYCLDPGVSRGADPSCEGDLTRSAAKTGTFSLVAPYYTGAISPSTAGDFSATVPASILSGRSSVDLFNGVSYLVLMTVSAEDGTTETAYRRVIATTRTTLNLNPSISALRKEGESSDLLTLPSLGEEDELSLVPVLGPADEETYSAQTLLGETVSRTEQLTVSWYAPQGTFTFLRTEGDSTNRYQIDPEATASPFVFAIVRDDRGGIGLLPQVVGQ